MTTEDKFRAAVKVVRGLPKTGPFQPSNELKLKFYSYFKQATEGPCSQPRPSFWDVINKTKWDAWHALGEMPREEAMENYVGELKKIIETMSYSDSVAEFMDVLGPMYESVPLEKSNSLPHLNGDKDSENDQELSSSSASPVRNTPNLLKQIQGKKASCHDADASPENPLYEQGIDGPTNVNGLSESSGSDSEVDEFSDTYDQIQEDDDDELRVLAKKQVNGDSGVDIQSESIVMVDNDNQTWSVYSERATTKNTDLQKSGDSGEFQLQDVAGLEASKRNGQNEELIVKTRGGGDLTSGKRIPNPLQVNPSGQASSRRHTREAATGSRGCQHLHMSGASGSGGQDGAGRSRPREVASDTTEQLAFAILRLQQKLDEVINRLDTLETLLNQQEKHNKNTEMSTWWPFGKLPMHTVLIIALWPLLAQWLLVVIQKRRHK
ncbi:acyl-CoA-binding domain-containing protein 5-like isoform X2 [Limulus polyphemus]|uniref:Acyl-CoA-binding domain-containing protein 5-like isoform X2 n=1 Tax=Limulus polyphemus TaxID=6850 RepID=A0ABM1B811_LIMPO|nr:acyl-CoA-binding domain-containing protein 5-like isoform X2 [Limulus polyphemus]